MALTRDSKIKELIESPEALAVIEQYMPGLSTNPGTKAAYGMKLKALAAFPQSKVSPEDREKMFVELEALGI